MDTLAAMRDEGHEQVSFFSDPSSGLRCIIAIHDTTLGPSLGGTRMWPYESEADALADMLADAPGPVVLVSNEVGQGIVPDNPTARRFRDEAGALHQRVAAAAGRVVLVTAGLAQTLKDTR